MHTLYDSYLYTTPTGDVSVNLTTTGQLISMDIPYEEGSKDLSTRDCVAIASSYLEEIGYKSMREVFLGDIALAKGDETKAKEMASYIYKVSLLIGLDFLLYLGIFPVVRS